MRVKPSVTIESLGSCQITIAKNYDVCGFRRFGASEATSHDREPGFMSDFFREFNQNCRAEATRYYGISTPSQRNCVTYDTSFDSRSENVCDGCRPKGLG